MCGGSDYIPEIPNILDPISDVLGTSGGGGGILGGAEDLVQGAGNVLAESDKFVNKDGTINTDLTFTPNILFAENLKNVTNVNDEYKESSIFSTQLRKLILEGLFNKGKLKPGAKSIHDSYLKNIGDYTNLVEFEF